MPDRRQPLTRADLPDRITADTIRDLPIVTLRRLSDHRNGVLTADEQRVFDRAIHQVMSGTADRVERQLAAADWSAVRTRERQPRRPGRPSRAEEHLRRVARRIEQEADLAGTLAPEVDWSFARAEAPRAPTTPPPTTPPPTTPPPTTSPPTTMPPTATTSTPPVDPVDPAAASPEQDGTIADLEARIAEQAELVDVMSEIAEVSRRTFALEQQRDLLTTRGVFFGFVVSVAVLVAGWAPLVAAADWTERAWTIGLTIGTCVVAGGVYALVRSTQNKRSRDDPDGG